MDILRATEKIMSMDEDVWQRHSNPLSVYSRFTTLPLLSVALWSREWIGVYSLALIALSIFWIWVNPRIFNKPESTDNWASMGTFGERIYLNRKNEHIAAHHIRACGVLQFLTALGVPLFLYGVYFLDVFILTMANLWIIVFKAWFVDRMVWVYRDTRGSSLSIKNG